MRRRKRRSPRAAGRRPPGSLLARRGSLQLRSCPLQKYTKTSKSTATKEENEMPRGSDSELEILFAIFHTCPLHRQTHFLLLGCCVCLKANKQKSSPPVAPGSLFCFGEDSERDQDLLQAPTPPRHGLAPEVPEFLPLHCAAAENCWDVG